MNLGNKETKPMAYLRKLSACALAAFMDFCLGVLIGGCVTKFFGIQPPAWLLFVSGLLAFAPDADIALQIFVGRSWGDHHRWPTHWPLLILPLVTVTAYALGGTMWGVLVFVCIFYHYLHDTQGFGGGGIAWLYPLSGFSYLGLRGWEDPDRVQLENVFWLERNWMRPSAMAKRELLIGFFALIVASVMVPLPFLIFVAPAAAAAVLVPVAFWYGGAPRLQEDL